MMEPRLNSDDDEDNYLKQLESIETLLNVSFDKDLDNQFGLPLLWDLVQSTTPLSKQAFDATKDILTQSNNEMKLIYIVKCIKNILSGIAIPQSIDQLQSILVVKYQEPSRFYDDNTSKIGNLVKIF